jgi:GT2 family glycosyltransferase
MRVATAVLHYRAWPDVRETLDALLAQTRRPDRIIVVDHASGDDSADAIRSSYPDVEVRELPINRGPAAGMHSALRYALGTGADAVQLLPHDCILAPDALATLEERLASNPGLGAVGPLVAELDDPERVVCAGGRVDGRTWDLELIDRRAAVSSWKGRPPAPVDFLEFAGILMRARAVEETGPLEERYYYWLDDAEFTLRMRAKGWRLECVPQAMAWQDVSYPSEYLVVRNRLLLVGRTAPRRLLFRELLRVVKHLLRASLRPHDPQERKVVGARLGGLLAFCLGRWGAPPTAKRASPRSHAR